MHFSFMDCMYKYWSPLVPLAVQKLPTACPAADAPASSPASSGGTWQHWASKYWASRQATPQQEPTQQLRELQPESHRHHYSNNSQCLARPAFGHISGEDESLAIDGRARHLACLLEEGPPSAVFAGTARSPLGMCGVLDAEEQRGANGPKDLDADTGTNSVPKSVATLQTALRLDARISEAAANAWDRTRHLLMRSWMNVGDWLALKSAWGQDRAGPICPVDSMTSGTEPFLAGEVEPLEVPDLSWQDCECMRPRRQLWQW